MNRFIMSLLLIAVACIGMGCAHKGEPPGAVSQQLAGSAVASSGVPTIEVPETSYDAGVVKDTEGEVVHSFKIKNVGTGVLRINKVLPG